MTEGGVTLEYTPTWIVAVVTSVIVLISLALERILHYAGKYLKNNDQKPLFQALRKIKEELMVLGFISLLLTVCRDRIYKICIPEHLSNSNTWMPCMKSDPTSAETTTHFQAFFSPFRPQTTVHRHLSEPTQNESSDPAAAYCIAKGKLPLLSDTALHHLHIFIFALAVVHVAFCAITILFGSLNNRKWKTWEKFALDKEFDPTKVLLRSKLVTQVQDHSFILSHFKGIGKRRNLLGWIHSFFKQFYGSVSKLDYITLRQGFINTHCRANPKFDFHRYMMRALEADFKKVVGISWYLWIFVVLFLLLNVHGWHTYFWMTSAPFVLLLAIGTKLEHVIIQLAHEVAEKHVSIEGALMVQPSDNHFWFHRPQIVLFLIHIILFQNSFEFAFFFWIWSQYGFESCIMGEIGYIIPRLVIGALIQFICSYSTLPLYAIVTQMGSSFNKAMFEQHIQKGLLGWAARSKEKGQLRKAGVGDSAEGHKGDSASPPSVQLAKIGKHNEITSDDFVSDERK